MTRYSNRLIPSLCRTAFFSMVAIILGVGCASDGESKKNSGGEVSVKLRRVEVINATFESMELRVVSVVANASSTDIALDGGSVAVTLLGKGDIIPPDESDAEVKENNSRMPTNEAEPVELDTVSDGDIVNGQWHEGATPAGVLPAMSETEVPAMVTIPLPGGSPATLKTLIDWQMLKLGVKGTLEFGGQLETFEGERQVGLPVLPTVKLEEAQVANEDAGKRGAAFFTIGIDNPNAFEITVDEFAWGVQIGDVQMTDPNKAVTEIVPPASVASFEDTIQVSQDSYGPNVKALLSQPRVPYIVTGYMQIRGIQIPFRFVGEMEFAR